MGARIIAAMRTERGEERNERRDAEDAEGGNAEKRGGLRTEREGQLPVFSFQLPAKAAVFSLLRYAGGGLGRGLIWQVAQSSCNIVSMPRKRD
jgi:hypothetical protein